MTRILEILQSQPRTILTLLLALIIGVKTLGHVVEKSVEIS